MFYKFVYTITKFIFRVLYRFSSSGLENIPNGAAIFAANHTSNADPFLAGFALPGAIRLRFMAKSELFGIFAVKQFISALGAYSVERGAGDIAAIRKTLEILSGGEKILIFPHGRRVLGGDAQAPFKTGAAMLALRSGAPLVPVYISRGRRAFVDKITVKIGKPFTAEREQGVKTSEQYEAVSERLRREIYGLKN